jgi:hypothetical protein
MTRENCLLGRIGSGKMGGLTNKMCVLVTMAQWHAARQLVGAVMAWPRNIRQDSAGSGDGHTEEIPKYGHTWAGHVDQTSASTFTPATLVYGFDGPHY